MASNSPENFISTNEENEYPYCTFRIFPYGARTKKNPRCEINFSMRDNRVNLSNIGKHLQSGNLYLWTKAGVILFLERDDCGWSVLQFVCGQIYDIKANPKATAQRQENFSKVSWEKVERDFNLEVEAKGTWVVGPPTVVPKSLPSSLKEQLLLMSTRHTFRAEAARRTVVTLLLLNAICHVDGQTQSPFLALDDGLHLRELRDTGIDVVEYTGSPDFIVGHSCKPPGLVKDTALIVVEAKKSADLKSQMAQVLAQASVILDLRRQCRPQRGHGEYLTYWLLSDGINWTIGYVRPGPDERILYGYSMTKSAQFTPFQETQFITIYEMLCALLERAKLSTPRGSTVDLHQGEELDIDVANAVLEISAKDYQGNEQSFD